MDPRKLHEFIQDVLTWDARQTAALILGGVIGLLLSLYFTRHLIWALLGRRPADDCSLIDSLRKDKDQLQNDIAERTRQNQELAGDAKVLRERLGRAKAEGEAKKQEAARLADQAAALSEECKKREVVIRQLHDWRRQAEQRFQSDASQLAQAHQAVHHLKSDKQNLLAERQASERDGAFLKQNVADLTAECERLREEAAQLEWARHEAGEQLAIARSEIEELRERLAGLTGQIESIAQADGRIWEAPVAQPLLAKPRRPTIISIVNLKGGVGKTTITANLGATLMHQGQRVLLVDLDYQGSLSGLCLAPAALEDLKRSQRLVQDLFESNGQGGQTLARIVTRMDPQHEGYIAAANDELADTEMRLLCRWLLRSGEADLRFLLRHILHDPALRERYDYVLLDCPPRLTAACVNALAASDYVLIPTLLDKTSADAVPRLLRWLQFLNQQLRIDLAVLGVLANRVSIYDGEPIAIQKDLWKELPARCQDVWRQPVHHFAAKVPNDQAIAQAASRHKFAIQHSRLEAVFKDIASEMRRRLPHHEGSRASAVS